MQATREAEEAARQAAEAARHESAERRAYAEAASHEAAQREAEAQYHAAAAAAAREQLRLAEIEEQRASELARREAQNIRAQQAQGGQVIEVDESRMADSIQDPYERPDHDYTGLEHIMHQPEVRDVAPFAKHSSHALHTSYAPSSFVAPQTEKAPMHTSVVPENPMPYPTPTRQGPPPAAPYQPASYPPVAQKLDVPVAQQDSRPVYPVYRPAAQAPPPGQAAYEQMIAEPRATYVPPQQYRPAAPQPPAQPAPRQAPVWQQPTAPAAWQPAPPTPPYAAPSAPATGKPQSADLYPLQQRPAWLYGEQQEAGTEYRPQMPVVQPQQGGPSPLANTLQQSRERVASRWFALKGVFEGAAEEAPQPQPVRQRELRTPALAVFSLAGGVGKTSIVATLGRALSSMGERVLLTDTTSYGLLPFYFGAREVRPGVVRTFSPPAGSADAPISLVNVDAERPGEPEEWLADEIQRNSHGCTRILLDLGTGSVRMTRRIARLAPTILVPIAPDMSSVIGLSGVEKYFADLYDADGRQIQPLYILNQFDPTLPLHLDVREGMRQQLGDRLLPFVLRRSPAVSEALAEGMTVMDYAPGSPVTEDFMNLASWLRSYSAPAVQAFRGARWSER